MFSNLRRSRCADSPSFSPSLCLSPSLVPFAGRWRQSCGLTYPAARVYLPLDYSAGVRSDISRSPTTRGILIIIIKRLEHSLSRSLSLYLPDAVAIPFHFILRRLLMSNRDDVKEKTPLRLTLQYTVVNLPFQIPRLQTADTGAAMIPQQLRCHPPVSPILAQSRTREKQSMWNFYISRQCDFLYSCLAPAGAINHSLQARP